MQQIIIDNVSHFENIGLPVFLFFIDSYSFKLNGFACETIPMAKHLMFIIVFGNSNNRDQFMLEEAFQHGTAHEISSEGNAGVFHNRP